MRPSSMGDGPNESKVDLVLGFQNLAVQMPSFGSAASGNKFHIWPMQLSAY